MEDALARLGTTIHDGAVVRVAKLLHHLRRDNKEMPDERLIGLGDVVDRRDRLLGMTSTWTGARGSMSWITIV